MRWAWWPAADAASWEWAWRGHPGVWVLLAGLLAGYVLARRRSRGSPAASRGRPAIFGSGALVLWLALDWPLGTLAAGYSLAAAAVQYLLISLVAAPLLLLGWPRGVPPAALDPAGSLLLVVAWTGAAVLLWWPLAGPGRARRRLSYAAGIGYLFVPFILPKAPGLIFAITTDPIYEVYAAAPRVGALTASTDQQVAGIMLWSAGTVMVFVSLGVLFFHWVREDRRLQLPDSLAVPADPRALDLLFAVPGAWAALEQLIAIVDRALPSAHTAAQLTFEVHGRRVTLVLAAALEAPADAALATAVRRDFAAYLATLEARRSAAIAAHLDFQVAGFGSRVA